MHGGERRLSRDIAPGEVDCDTAQDENRCIYQQ